MLTFSKTHTDFKWIKLKNVQVNSVPIFFYPNLVSCFGLSDVVLCLSKTFENLSKANDLLRDYGIAYSQIDSYLYCTVQRQMHFMT